MGLIATISRLADNNKLCGYNIASVTTVSKHKKFGKITIQVELDDAQRVMNALGGKGSPLVWLFIVDEKDVAEAVAQNAATPGVK